MDRKPSTRDYPPICSQCGQDWWEDACGPTHALIAHEVEEAEGRRLDDEAEKAAAAGYDKYEIYD